MKSSSRRAQSPSNQASSNHARSLGGWRTSGALTSLALVLWAGGLASTMASGCGGNGGDGNTTGDDAATDDSSVAEASTDGNASDVAPETTETGPTGCTIAGLTPTPFASGAYGTHRGDLSDDFTVPLTDGTTWSLKDHWTGCESFVVLTDLTTVSSTNAAPAFGVAKDLAQLIKQSPKNVHYLFLAARANPATAKANITAQDAAVKALLAGMSASDAAFWSTHLHVIAQDVRSLDATKAWFSKPILGWFQYGFAVDPRQHIRGVGTLADVRRPDGSWFGNNVAYASTEADYMNADSVASNAVDAEGGTVVTLFDEGLTHTEVSGASSTSGILTQYAEADAVLPTAAQMSKFDTMEIEVTQRCPQNEVNELQNNCGAWDYIAFLGVAPLSTGAGGDAGADASADGAATDASAADAASVSDAGKADAGSGDAAEAGDAAPPPPPPPAPIELARFITSYHRETHWIVDATPMLTELSAGGTRHFHWEFAPPWNGQPTATTVKLHFSNKKKGTQPTKRIPLFTGGSFDSKYNTSHTPVTAKIPATAKRVELWAIITGHGGDTSTNCAEFCDHQHQFTVGSSMYTKDYPMAGTQTGCVADTANLMTPNQAGTWWYGRGGWCPGAPVIPWSVDVTKDAPAGSSVTVSYQALLGGSPPPDTTGNIDMVSYLVVYE